MYVLRFNVPESHLEVVKNAVFEAGAGNIGHYSHGSWQVLGEGQFMPLPGSNAFIGEIGVVATVPEYHVETICDEAHIKAAVAALRRVHPYETPSVQVWKLEDF
jgi:structural hemagglutinin/hemolysin toxin protein RtxA